MDKIMKARLASTGGYIEYVAKDAPPKGTMKYTYFTPDRRKAVQFFNDPEKAARDTAMRSRVDAIIGRYNPTKPASAGGSSGGNERTAKYFSEMFCWPEDTICEPEYGVVCPAFPPRFLMPDNACVRGTLAENGINKRDKITTFFTNPAYRQRLRPEVLGDFRGMLSCALMLSKAVWRMHIAGLAHTDLSCNNVLIDPVSGTSIIIDIDTLAVPGIFSPVVSGSSRYLAPEVLETLSLPANQRTPASALTDDYAMSVLIYEMLLRRHPLIGRKQELVSSSAKNNKFALNQYVFGSGALFIEHPVETINRPNDLRVTIDDMGSGLRDTFIRAFVDGLHDPNRRPGADRWVRALESAYDLLQPCSNPNCPEKWFILHDTEHAVCPFCGTPVRSGENLRLHLCAQLDMLPGQWYEVRTLNGYSGLELHQWHVRSDFSNDSDSDKQPFARLLRSKNGWLIENLSNEIMITGTGAYCPPGGRASLRPGMTLRTGESEFAYLIDIQDK